MAARSTDCGCTSWPNSKKGGMASADAPASSSSPRSSRPRWAISAGRWPRSILSR
ncbi:Uncharacterised protein [Bordetella pertussis]|nr:Uncharacterised protein [Bordetella pertussis]